MKGVAKVARGEGNVNLIDVPEPVISVSFAGINITQQKVGKLS